MASQPFARLGTVDPSFDLRSATHALKPLESLHVPGRRRDQDIENSGELEVVGPWSEMAAMNKSTGPWFERPDPFYDGPRVLSSDEEHGVRFRDTGDDPFPEDSKFLSTAVERSILRTLSDWGHLTRDQLVVLSSVSERMVAHRIPKMISSGIIEVGTRMSDTNSHWVYRIGSDQDIAIKAQTKSKVHLRAGRSQNALTDSLAAELACRLVEMRSHFKLTAIIPEKYATASNLLGDEANVLGDASKLRTPKADFAAVLGDRMIIFEIERSKQSNKMGGQEKLGAWMAAALLLKKRIHVVFVNANQTKPSALRASLTTDMQSLNESAEFIGMMTGRPAATMTSQVTDLYRSAVSLVCWEDWFPAPNTMERAFLDLSAMHRGSFLPFSELAHQLEPVNLSKMMGVRPVVWRSSEDARKANTIGDPYDRDVPRITTWRGDPPPEVDMELMERLKAFRSGLNSAELSWGDSREERTFLDTYRVASGEVEYEPSATPMELIGDQSADDVPDLADPADNASDIEPEDGLDDLSDVEASDPTRPAPVAPAPVVPAPVASAPISEPVPPTPVADIAAPAPVAPAPVAPPTAVPVAPVATDPSQVVVPADEHEGKRVVASTMQSRRAPIKFVWPDQPWVSKAKSWLAVAAVPEQLDMARKWVRDRARLLTVNDVDTRLWPDLDWVPSVKAEARDLWKLPVPADSAQANEMLKALMDASPAVDPTRLTWPDQPWVAGAQQYFLPILSDRFTGQVG